MKNCVLHRLPVMLLALTWIAAASGEEPTKPHKHQDQADDKKSMLTVLLDVEEVLSSSIPLNRQLADLLEEAEQFAAKVAEERKALGPKRNDLKRYKIGAPEYLERAREIAREEGAIKGEVEFQQSEFRRREAGLYSRAYAAIQKEVELFAVEHDITLVENFSRKPVDEVDMMDVELAVKNSVVFYKNLDITSAIIDAVNQKAEKTADANSVDYRRPIEELRATGLRFPFYRRPEKNLDISWEAVPGSGGTIIRIR